MIQREEFNRLVRDALANLYDYAALETHELAEAFPKPTTFSGTQAGFLRELLEKSIHALRPPRLNDASDKSPEVRPYFVLCGRYLEGQNLHVSQDQMGLSERQLRREHVRAVRAVSALLWDRLQRTRSEEPSTIPVQPVATPPRDSFRSFPVARERLNVAQLVDGIAGMLRQRITDDDAVLHILLPENLPAVDADRIILRQILLTLLSCIFDGRASGDVKIEAKATPDQVILEITSQIVNARIWTEHEDDNSLELVRYWASRLDATLKADLSINGDTNTVCVTLGLRRADQPLILVADDQPTAIRMFQRFLSPVNYRVIGVQQPERVLETVRVLQPAAIVLDVMMPTMDGWEILQALQIDPLTRGIPVIMCSVWNEPELAHSLGAAGLLRKPVTQHALIDAISRVAPGRLGECSAAET